MTHPELSWYEWKVLSLVNERCLASPETIAHQLYGRQTAVPRCMELINMLLEKGLIENAGHRAKYRWMTSEKGDDYIENAIKPLPTAKVKTGLKTLSYFNGTLNDDPEEIPPTSHVP